MCMLRTVLFIISENNCLKILDIAHRYQHAVLVDRCRKAMKQIVQTEPHGTKAFLSTGFVSRNVSHEEEVKAAENHLVVLKKSIEFEFNDVIDEAVGMIGRYSSKVYLNEHPFIIPRRDAVTIFKNLPDNIKCRIFEIRLRHVDNDSFKYMDPSEKKINGRWVSF